MFASSKIAPMELAPLVQGYRLCARSEGKSENTIDIVANSVGYLERFLCSLGLSTDVRQIGPQEIRGFILHLKGVRRLADHPFSKTQDTGLSGHTINCYLRSIRAFWSWLVSEEVIEGSPFAKVRIPKAPHKVIPPFSDDQLRALLDAIDTSTAEGYRDLAMILTLLDTGLRVSELASLRVDDAHIAEGVLKVVGKGNKERLIPIGRQVQRILWRYMSRHRPEPALPQGDLVFLTRDGMPVTRDRIQKTMSRYGRKAGLRGVRCSAHTLRHTAAVRFLRSGGNAFELQRLLGHSSLEVTRLYCELADIDVKRAHRTASPVDNLSLQLPPGNRGSSLGKADSRCGH